MPLTSASSQAPSPSALACQLPAHPGTTGSALALSRHAHARNDTLPAPAQESPLHPATWSRAPPLLEKDAAPLHDRNGDRAKPRERPAAPSETRSEMWKAPAHTRAKTSAAHGTLHSD